MHQAFWAAQPRNTSTSGQPSHPAGAVPVPAQPQQQQQQQCGVAASANPSSALPAYQYAAPYTPNQQGAPRGGPPQFQQTQRPIVSDPVTSTATVNSVAGVPYNHVPGEGVAPGPAASGAAASGAREAPAISGANSAAATISASAVGVFFSGTRTNYTDVVTLNNFGMPGSTTASGPGGGAPGAAGGGASPALVDPNDVSFDEISQLLMELEYSVDRPHSAAVLRDTVDAIEARAVANYDPLARDVALEQRIRDVIAELSRNTSERSMMLACSFIEALVPIAYTASTYKFTRLCRSLSTLMQCGQVRPAREAQRVFKLLLEEDLAFRGRDPPLKAFVPKELKEACEQALVHLHGRSQQSTMAFPSTFYATLLTCAAVAEVHPSYLSGNVRVQAVQLATTLAGSSDALLQNTACECLTAIFSNCTGIRANEVVLENRRLCDECLRILNSSQHNEGNVVSALKALRALLRSRGLSCIEKQLLPQLCVVVTEQQRAYKTPMVREAVCDLIPIIAPVDISMAPRRTVYCSIIMDPVKNVREESSKARELQNVAAFVTSVGYNVFDDTNKNNLESILSRYMARPATQEACWAVVAAIAASQVRSQGRRESSMCSPNAPRPDRVFPAGSGRGGMESPRMSEGGMVVSPTTAIPSRSLSISITTPDATANLGETAGPCNALDGDNGETPVTTAISSITTHTLQGVSVAPSTGERPASTTSAAPDSHTEALVRRFLPLVAQAALTQPLVDALTLVRDSLPSLRGEVSAALDQLVDGVLQSSTPSTLPRYVTGGGGSTPIMGPQGGPAGGGGGGGGGGDRRGWNGAGLSPNGSFATLGAGSVGSGSVNTSSGPGAGRFSQYFRGAEGGGSAEPSIGDKSPNHSAQGAPNRHLRAPPLQGMNNENWLGAKQQGGTPVGGPRTGMPNTPVTSTSFSSPSVAAGGIFSKPLASLSTVYGSPSAPQPSSASPPAPIPVSDCSVALKLFAKRHFTDVMHLDELKRTVIAFQCDSDPLVRQQSSETVITSLTQWITYAKENNTSTYSSRVTETLEAYVKNVLLEVDPRCQLREISLLAEATMLRPFLSEEHILASLLSFLNGASPAREKTVELLVAITQSSQPSQSVTAIQQSLYVMVESCVVVLEYTSNPRMLIRNMADLRTFTRLCVKPLSNHLGRIFYAFRKRLSEVGAPDVVCLALLKTLESVLTALSKEECSIVQYQDDVLELYEPVVEILKQTSSPALSHAAISVLVNMNRMCISQTLSNVRKRQELINALIQICTSNSCASEESLTMLTLFGQIGAVDPSAQCMTISTKKTEEAAVQDEADLELTYDYTVIVYRTLSRMLDLTLPEPVCSQALRTLLHFLRSTQDKKDLVGGVHAVRAVLQVAKRSTDSPALRIEALHVLASITVMRHERIAKLVLPEIVVMLEQLWAPADHALFRGVLEVVSALKPGKLSGKEQSESWAWLYPRLVDVAVEDHTESREFCLRVVEIILNASYIPPHCIPIVFPMLLRFVQQRDQLVEVRSQSLCAAVHIVCELKAVQFFSSLMHGIRTLARHCELNEDLGLRLSTAGVRESLKVLNALHPSGKADIRQLRDRLGEMEDRAAASQGGGHGPLATAPGPGMASGIPGAMSASGAANRRGAAGAAPGGAYLRRNVSETFSTGDDDNALSSMAGVDRAGGGGNGQEIQHFMRHVEQGFRLKESKLREWFSEFQKYIVVVSPHPSIRMMVDLIDKHEPLRRELFLPSFKCLYESLSIEHIRKLNEVLAILLNCSDHELSSKCLGLADYLDHNEPSLKPETIEAVRALRRAESRIGHPLDTDSVLVRSAASSNTPSRTVGNPSISPPSDPSAIAKGVRLPKTKVAVPRLPMSSSPNGTQLRQAQNEINSGESGVGEQDRGRQQSNSRDGTGSDAVTFGSSSTKQSPPLGHRAVGAQASDDAPLHTACDGGTPRSLVDTLGADSDDDDGAAGRQAGTIEEEDALTLPPAGSYKPLVSSVSASNKNSRRTNSTAGTVVDIEEKMEPDPLQLAPGSSHVPSQPNVLFGTEDIVRAAEQTRMYDKALSRLENRLLSMLNLYRNTKMPQDVVQRTVWPLAWLYNQREMHDSVVGLFRTIHYQGGDDKDGFGYELLRGWSEAQQMYAKSVTEESLRSMMILPHILEGYLRTLTLCGEWAKALSIARQLCQRPDMYVSSTIAQSGATAAWMLGNWDEVRELAGRLSTVERHNTAARRFFLDGAALYQAIQDKSPSSYEDVRFALSESKLAINDALRTLLSVSYSHAYDNLTMLQHFTEMEETLDYTQSRSEAARQQMRERWTMRFRNLKPDSLQPSLRSLMLHSLVLSTNDMSEMILHFCEAMRTDYPQLAEWAMNWLRRGTPGDCAAPLPNCGAGTVSGSTQWQLDGIPHSNPNVIVGYITHIWCQRQRTQAVDALEDFLNKRGTQLEEDHATCYGNAQLRLGTWKLDLHADSFWKRGFRDEELNHFHRAIRAIPESYQAWHSWGLMNYRVQQRDHLLSPEEQRTFVEAAHQGFVGAICRCHNSSEALPGVMRLLQLWVVHNGVSLLKEAVADSICRIPVDHWVQAIPQLIGHLGNENHDIREMISMILRSLCETHPQAVVFPLLVVKVSEQHQNHVMPPRGGVDGEEVPECLRSPTWRKHEIVNSVIQHCPKRILHEAEMVTRLLVDVSAIPIEKIRENLSQVATAWNPNAEYEEDPEETSAHLQSTLQIFEVNKRHLLYTVGDIGQFVKIVLDDLKRGNRSKAAGMINQLVEEISKHVAEKLGREPQKAMEPLLRLRNLSVAVFGEYDIECRDTYPTIASFSSKLDVIPSKKRPRRIQLNGSDGCLYSYCLKGNEDIRMDERVMQLFGMVNVLLSHTRTSSSAYIHRFPVIPISSNVGLLGWVENANTINNTICNHRATISSVRTHQESNVLRAYVESFGHWDKLSIIQRTEVLDFVMNSENCEAVDVARAMWHRANTAEQWLDRRTTFTVSLATMSMVGYVMGLGDRHLGNILLSMSTGKIVHIDFGDSFDVGRLRHVLPETVPFRLTRMLTNAMEVFGVNGIFRASAARTQKTLHSNRDSIMALLSAFVYDPIVQHKGKLKNMMEKSHSPQDVAERIRNKLRGTEMAVEPSRIVKFNTTQDSCRRPDLLFMSTAFDDDTQRNQAMVMTPEEQVDFLINEATRVDNYTTLYFGWGPLW